jgi:hypothetical protein
MSSIVGFSRGRLGLATCGFPNVLALLLLDIESIWLVFGDENCLEAPFMETGGKPLPAGAEEAEESPPPVRGSMAIFLPSAFVFMPSRLSAANNVGCFAL